MLTNVDLKKWSYPCAQALQRDASIAVDLPSQDVARNGRDRDHAHEVSVGGAVVEHGGANGEVSEARRGHGVASGNEIAGATAAYHGHCGRHLDRDGTGRQGGQRSHGAQIQTRSHPASWTWTPPPAQEE